jgi:hypothetical protein
MLTAMKNRRTQFSVCDAMEMNGIFCVVCAVKLQAGRFIGQSSICEETLSEMA